MRPSKFIATLFFILTSSIICFSQHVVLSSQADVDAFDPSTTVIIGNLHIGGFPDVYSDIHDLSNLSNLEQVNSLSITLTDSLANLDALSNLTGDLSFLRIRNNNALLNMDGLSGINSIQGFIDIISNPVLVNMDGLSAVTSFGDSGYIDISNNESLTNMDGLSNMNTGPEIYFIIISNNPVLENLTSFSSATIISDKLDIRENSSLETMDAFSNVTSIGNLYIEHNYSLNHINGLANLDEITNSLVINSNTSLIHLDGLVNLNYIGTSLTIYNNNNLENINGLLNISSLDGNLNISYNDTLNNCDGLANITHLGGNLNIHYNNNLTNLDGLSSLDSLAGDLSITSNPLLSDCCGIQHLLFTPGTIGGNIYISSNLASCSNLSAIMGDECGNNFNVNMIEGRVFIDVGGNCLYDQGDIPYEGIIVQAFSDERIYTVATNSLGDYKIYLDTGVYEVKTYAPNPYIELCTASYSVEILDDTVSDSFNFEFPAIAAVLCPYLEVDVGVWALRECFDNNYRVQYSNSGTVSAEDAYIELELDGSLSIVDSDIPFTGPDDNNIYTFKVGTVSSGEQNSFNLNIHLPCDTLNVGQFQGQTLCVNAHIYPDSICLPPLDIWDGSSIQIAGVCDEDSVRFRVRNAGPGDMLSGKDLHVFEDQVMFMEHRFQLQSGEEIMLSYFANGSTFRLDAEQSDGHPGNSQPSIAVEGCGAEPIFSLGFINQFPQDDGNIFTSSECREVTGSYDPNDKQAFPVGYGGQHFIEKNTDIEYLIRFQNTGTDTAFTVVIQDEISPLFDISTIQPGASSHPYVFEIDSVARFVFNDILLVDSLTNEAASHGFVKFKISQQADLPNGTLLENTAEIYFDFNAPIITNTAFHTVGENFVTVDLIDGISDLFQIASIRAYPNPFSDAIHFELEGNVFEEIVLSVFDVNGKQVATQDYHSSTFRFNREGLNSGVYFYTLSSQGMDIANGKMILR